MHSLSIKLSILLSSAITIGLFIVSPASQAQTTSEHNCVDKDDSGTIVVLLCPVDSESEQWRSAAVEICGERTYCNAWIWTNKDIAPSTAPKIDSDFSTDVTKHAVAVWAHDSQSLIKIRTLD